jgi:hypothetical protein
MSETQKINGGSVTFQGDNWMIIKRNPSIGLLLERRVPGETGRTWMIGHDTDTCRCGQRILIEKEAKNTCRKDGKRLFYPDREDKGECAFRCKNCGEPLDETCPRAAFNPALAKGTNQKGSEQ